MPYSKAHHLMFVLLAVTVIAFWPSYFAVLSEAPLAHHIHGITATVWILLIALQSWLIHHGKRQQHRKAGLLIFIMVPLMTAAFALVTWLGAIKAVGQHPFYVEIGQALLTADVLLIFATALQIYLALKFRRNVHVHSALIISTLFGLLPPILSRLFSNHIPSMQITSLDSMYRFAYAIQLSILVTFLMALALALIYRKSRWPWLLAASISFIIYLIYSTVGYSVWWGDQTQIIASLNPLIAYGFGFLLGLFACVLGWHHGKSNQVNKP
ncbi:hypothetical protein [Marinicella litoralis]|uniref:Uncharacterized protein n=1 Tax=Marinicella litoralis TaxID=644220 RepID=A0A4R6XHM1_9GAMM|nr:hypothetical protein [Marinicella litoralis]TDR16857.1 hypothetical protein C8D91_2764 [Marinicella litoralis]